MAKQTIRDAIAEVLGDATGPMTANEIYKEILNRNLYDFKAKDPLNIVRNQLRRHCKNLECTTSASVRDFKLLDDGRFVLETG